MRVLFVIVTMAIIFTTIISNLYPVETNSANSRSCHYQENNSYIDKNLRKCIINYISINDNNFWDKEWLYYSLFFFRNNSTQYFTIWNFTSFPGYIAECIDTSNYYFSLNCINNRKVVMIDEKSNNNPVFKPSERSIEFAQREHLKEYSGDMYSGPLNFKTYKVLNRKGIMSIVELDTAFSHFINCRKLKVKDTTLIKLN